MNKAPYGSWKSPISSALVAASSVKLNDLTVEGDFIYWLEGRAAEGGRNVLIQCDPDGSTKELTPPEMNVRTLAHEYGGGAYVVSEGEVFFSNYTDQRLYRINKKGLIEPISPANSKYYYADAIVDRKHNRIICVCEDHSYDGEEAITTLVEINLADGKQEMLAAGNDFYSSVRLSPDGKQLAWLSWSHPNMPWDGTSLWVAPVGNDGSLSNIGKIAGSPTESIIQPEWSPDGILHYISDRSGWWNIYRHEDYTDGETVWESQYEFGGPQWVFGLSTYAFLDAETIIATYCDKGVWRLARIDLAKKTNSTYDLPFTHYSYVHVLGSKAVFKAGSPTQSSSVTVFDLKTKEINILKSSSSLKIEEGYLSIPKMIEFSTVDGGTGYAFYYPPTNKDFQAPPGEKPPLLVESHGGPTSASLAVLSTGIQFWTSRGFAVLDVNYGGSSGFGRQYRDRLKGKWGIVDVDDCCSAAQYLIEEGEVDAKKCAITGGSAGGYTTLCALTFRKLFNAGASYYGISDLESLALETHKFESRYHFSLIAPYPEAKDIYIERSPIHFTNQISCPMILLQGLEDKVVPPNQSEKMYDVLRSNGLPVAYLPFAGEQHGFRKAETIQSALEAELYFYGRIFGFTPADELKPVEIANYAMR
jgi:dipeptidyl aminopeptidase/acylaminoacyl peptidase